MHEWVQRPELGERPLVFVVGAFAHGKIDDSYVDEYISISQVRAPLGAGAGRARLPFPVSPRSVVVAGSLRCRPRPSSLSSWPG